METARSRACTRRCGPRGLMDSLRTLQLRAALSKAGIPTCARGEPACIARAVVAPDSSDDCRRKGKLTNSSYRCCGSRSAPFSSHPHKGIAPRRVIRCRNWWSPRSGGSRTCRRRPPPCRGFLAHEARMIFLSQGAASRRYPKSKQPSDEYNIR